jgi:hypothetical protein
MQITNFKIFLPFICATTLTLSAQAGVIGNWEGSSRSWNFVDMIDTRNAMIAAGHTVLPDGPISATALAGMTAFLIGEPSTAPVASELAELSAWINGGGTLLVMFDSKCNGCSGGNPTLAGVGSTMSAGGNASVAPYPAGHFATAGLVGQTLHTTPGTAISGGTAIAGSYIHYEAIGLGYVFAFGDRSDHGYFGSANYKLFDNILRGGGTPQQPEQPEQPEQPGAPPPEPPYPSGADVPEPSTAILLLLGFAGLMAYSSGNRL